MVVFLLISLSPVIILGVINYGNAERQITSETVSKLNSLANIEEDATKVVLQNSLERLESFTTRLQLKIELDKFNTSQDTKSQEFINNLILQVKSQIPSIKDISVLNTEGTVVASTVKDEIGTDHANDEFFLRGTKSNDVSIFFKDTNSVASLYLVGPLVLNGKIVGVAAITSDLSSVYSITSAFSKSSATGESYLLLRDQNGDALVLTPLRFEPDSVLNTRIPKEELNRPATQALLGNEITMTDAIDYRGRTVLAVTRYIEGADLGLVVKIDREEATGPLENLKYLTIVSTALGGVAIISTSLYLGKSLSLPVRRLRDKVKEISKGNFDVVGAPIVSKWDDEVGELAIHFDEMRKNMKSMKENLQHLVQEKTKELQAANTRLESTNMSLQSLNKVLEEQKEQLHEADAIKEEFSAMVTHELRTPLVPVIGYTELLLDGTLGSLTEKQRETVKVINTSASSLLQLISDLLDARKLELGKMKLEKREASAKELVEHCVNAFKPLAQAKGIHLTTKVEQEQFNDRLMIISDAKRMRQVLDNLVNNAIKFSPANVGKIEVSVKKEDIRGGMLFAVKDNGTGIPKNKQHNIFQKFYQADTSTTRNAGGTGLGLAISKGIIEAHDGRIWFESEPGVGSTFFFSIPASLNSSVAITG